MLTNTAAYNTAIKETVRKFHAKVEITWTDPFIDSTIVVSANDENYIHSLCNSINHVADINLRPAYKYAHLNSQGTYSLIADGSFHPFPGTDLIANSNEVGWWGSVKCNSDGEWTTSTGTTTTTGSPYGNPTLTITFASRPFYAFIVCGDNIYGEYPLSFIVRLYTLSTDVVPIYTDTVTNSVGIGWTLSKVDSSDSIAVKWSKSLSPIINSCQKMELEVVKWSTPFAVVKIAEFYTSIVKTYSDDDIISMSLLEEMEIADGSLPIGNISCNELDLKLQNIEDEFFVGNTDSDIYTQIKRNRRIKAWIGLELPDTTTEWKLLGTFFSGDWQAGELETYASTTARDRMELLRKATFDVSELEENISAYDLLVIVLEDAKAKIKDLQYSIDVGMTAFIYPYAWFEKVSYFECLKKIVGSCMGYAYMDKNDVLRIDTNI